VIQFGRTWCTDTLGNYARFAIKTGALKDAEPELYRALRRKSNHRQNLESLAFYLNVKGSPDAIIYYQRSLQTYFEHWYYRDNYANSSEAMFITSLKGTILDCNPAALALFRAKNRGQLCTARMGLHELEEVTAGGKSEISEELRKLAAVVQEKTKTLSKVQSGRCECSMQRLNGEVVSVEALFTLITVRVKLVNAEYQHHLTHLKNM